jgi:hypothetical protein
LYGFSKTIQRLKTKLLIYLLTQMLTRILSEIIKKNFIKTVDKKEKSIILINVGTDDNFKKDN